jgi:hypothetical protein
MLHQVQTPRPNIQRHFGIHLQNISTGFSEDIRRHKERRVRSPTVGDHRIQETAHYQPKTSNKDFVEISRWSSSSESSQETNSQSESEMADTTELPESYEETQERHRKFFSNRPLMRCLDIDEEQLMADFLFERLLNEVKQATVETDPSRYRGELRVRAFWKNVRKQLRFDDDDDPWFNYWPEGYPPNTEEEDSSYKTWAPENLTPARDEGENIINRHTIQVHFAPRDRTLPKLYSALKFSDGSFFRPQEETRRSILSTSRNRSRTTQKYRHGSLFR